MVPLAAEYSGHSKAECRSTAPPPLIRQPNVSRMP